MFIEYSIVIRKFSFTSSRTFAHRTQILKIFCAYYPTEHTRPMNNQPEHPLQSIALVAQHQEVSILLHIFVEMSRQLYP